MDDEEHRISNVKRFPSNPIVPEITIFILVENILSFETEKTIFHVPIVIYVIRSESFTLTFEKIGALFVRFAVMV